MGFKVYAGIVSYNPDITKIKANIEAVYPQVDAVIVNDNGSRNTEELRKLCARYPQVHLIENGENIGIASALNIIFRNAALDGAEWVLSLDQDSCVDTNFMKSSIPYMNDVEKVSLTTLRRDRNASEILNYDASLSLQVVGRCITSGNLVRVRVWQEVGGFNESLFIDSVDHEFCYRLREHGYNIYQINRVLITHELGDSRRVRFLWKTPIVRNHNAFRKYYICRNLIYLMRYVRLSSEYHPRKELIATILKILLYEKQKRKKIIACVKGIYDGIRMKEYVYHPIVIDVK